MRPLIGGRCKDIKPGAAPHDHGAVPRLRD